MAINMEAQEKTCNFSSEVL